MSNKNKILSAILLEAKFGRKNSNYTEQLYYIYKVDH